jgi:hypothetical protein
MAASLGYFIAGMTEKKNTCRILLGKPERKSPLGRPRCDGRIILKWILEKQVGVLWTGLIWLRIWTRGGIF